MKFFTLDCLPRCRVLSRVLTVAIVILGIVLTFGLYGITDTVKLTDPNSNRELMLFLFVCILFIIVLITKIVLRCIINDLDSAFEFVIENQKDIASR